ncbi:MAG TPA: zf-HC2 domain-containing protein [Thermoanaerobaculia bacterium]|nr:zf-HC2 domain-containing protein [Thermoanaerobaculia bacterium]
MTAMDHDYIETNDIADRYLLGRLTPEEADRFEEHYLSCQECLGRLDRAERFQRGLKRAAAEDAARMAAVRQAGFFAVLARLGRSRQAGLAMAAALIVLILPAMMAYREFGRLGRQLDQANEALSAREQQVVPPAASVDDGADRAAREQLEAERRRLAEELERERAARGDLEKDLAQAWQPQTNTPILSLSPERSGPGDGDPVHQVRLPAAPGWIVLSLELDRPEYEHYRVTLLREGGDRVWRSGGLEPNGLDSLAVSLPTNLLKPGDYLLRVEGTPDGGQPAAVAQFSFRALKSGSY